MDEFDKGSLVYIDSNIFMYFIEGQPEFSSVVRAVFEKIAAAGAIIVTSELTLAECIFKPAREGDQELIALYQNLFRNNEAIETLPIGGAIVELAVLSGGTIGLKLLDAVHYISAMEAGCHFFVTGDSAFKSGPLMTVIAVAP
jgi:predicted nucleic acid-binding protein